MICHGRIFISRLRALSHQSTDLHRLNERAVSRQTWLLSSFPLAMAEFTSFPLSTIILFESRLLEYAHRKREQFLHVLRRLSYTRYSWRLVFLMLQISPRSTTVIILGRFLEGVIPSLDLRIKGAFLDMVSPCNA
jgi:hypothetical protein